MTWSEREGRGFYPATVHGTYVNEYLDKYDTYETLEMGKKITQARVDLVRRHIGTNPLVDFGCGNGSFIRARGDMTWGYDVCKRSVKWLVDQDLWWDPWFKPMPSASFWDSFEHVEDIDKLVSRVLNWAFLSIPIFRSHEHAMKSHHFRPMEHFHYFTDWGLVLYMKKFGFKVIESNFMETSLGREDIGTFAFRR